MLNGGSMVWGFCVYFVYMIPLETDVLRKHRFQKSILKCVDSVIGKSNLKFEIGLIILRKTILFLTSMFYFAIKSV